MSIVTLLERTSDSLTVAWPSHAQRYELQMRAGDAEWATLSDKLTKNFAKKKSLSPELQYSFRVRSTGAEEWSEPSEVFSPVPSEVHQLAAPVQKASDGSSITIEWIAVPGATGYQLRFREEKDIHWTVVPTTIARNFAKKKNLQPNTNYIFSVVPVGAGDWEYSIGSEAYQVARAAASTLVGANNQTFPPSVLHNKVVGLYFSASWCGPCRRFTPQLAELYTAAQEAGLPFEIVFVSADQTEHEWRNYLSHMPWKAYEFSDPNRETLQESFQVNGIPRLVILAPDGSVIENNAVGQPLSVATIQHWVKRAGLSSS